MTRSVHVVTSDRMNPVAALGRFGVAVASAWQLRASFMGRRIPHKIMYRGGLRGNLRNIDKAVRAHEHMLIQAGWRFGAGGPSPKGTGNLAL